MGRDPKGVVSSTASGPVEIPPPVPVPPRRRGSDTRENTLHTIERRMEEVDARLTILETRVDTVVHHHEVLENYVEALHVATDNHDRWINELQRWMDGTRQRDEWGPRRLWLRCWDVIRRWWRGG